MWLNRIKILAIICLTLLSCAYIPVAAQRVVTPVESNDLPLEVLKKENDKARKAQNDSTAAARADSIRNNKDTEQQPLFEGILFSADISSPIMNIFGVQYGNYEVAMEFDLLHRFFPVVELGIGQANYTPEANNYTFLCNPSFYGRVGLNYNFLYKNRSNSFITVGVRYGLTGFSYSWQNISLTDPYWGTELITNTPRQDAFAHWGEIVVGLRVQVYRNFYMGFTGRYRILIGCDSSDYGDPYFIPGFGPKGSGFGFTYVVGYNLPFGNKKKEIKTP